MRGLIIINSYGIISSNSNNGILNAFLHITHVSIKFNSYQCRSEASYPPRTFICTVRSPSPFFYSPTYASQKTQSQADGTSLQSASLYSGRPKSTSIIPSRLSQGNSQFTLCLLRLTSEGIWPAISSFAIFYALRDQNTKLLCTIESKISCCRP